MPFEPEEAAPVRLNMTPMIDVVFQLIVFFLCSMKFKSLDWKIETTLPDDRGPAWSVEPVREVPKLSVQLRSAPGGETVVKSAGVTLGRITDGKGVAALHSVRALTEAAIERSGGVAGAEQIGLLCELDAGPRVPTGDVLAVADVFRSADAPKITFFGTPEPRPDMAGPAPR